MSAQSSTPMAIPPEILSSNADVSFGVHPYKAPALMVFSIIGLILQVPVSYTHCGIFGAPNAPVMLMSVFYFYFMLSTTIAAAHWSHGDTTQWWSGKGWCDIDSRLGMAFSLGSLSAQCSINFNIICMSRWRPQAEKRRTVLIRTIWQTCACLFLPVVNSAVSTFTTYRRYRLTQNVGCAAVLDGSAALIVIFFMWIPFLAAIAFFTILFIAYRFWQQGTNKTIESISFVPNMSASQFLRIIGFACIVTFVVVPLSVVVAAINFITIRSDGVQESAWAHGKPENWGEILKVNFAELSLIGDNITRATVIVNSITMYVNVGIAWLIFSCYGTGSSSMKAYRTFFHTVHGWFGHFDPPKLLHVRRQSDTDVVDDSSVDLKNRSRVKTQSISNSFRSVDDDPLKDTDFDFNDESTNSRRLSEVLSKARNQSFNEWNSNQSSADLFREWESNTKLKKGNESFSASSPESETSACVTPTYPQQAPAFPMRDFLGMKSFFQSSKPSK